MQAIVVHFCGKIIFFPWVPFIQMQLMINISLHLLIGIWIQTNNFIMNKIMWLFINKKSIC